MATVPTDHTAQCPRCAGIIPFDKPPKTSQIIVCPFCDELLEVQLARPLTLMPAFEVVDTAPQTNENTVNTLKTPTNDTDKDPSFDA